MTRQLAQRPSIINLDTWRQNQTGRPRSRLTEDLRAMASVEAPHSPLRSLRAAPAALHVHLCLEHEEAPSENVACPSELNRQLPPRPTAVLEADLDRLLKQLDSELQTLNQRLNLVLNLSSVAADQNANF